MATASFKSKGMLEVSEFKGLAAYVDILSRLPDTMHRTIIKSAVNAAIDPVLKAGRSLAPKGVFPPTRMDGSSRSRLAGTFIKKAVVLKDSNVGVGLAGSASRSAPHGHLVHGGTGEFVTGSPSKGSRKPRRGTRDYIVPPGKVLRIPVESFHRYSRKGNAFQRNPIGGYIFIRGGRNKQTVIKNRGSRPNPWWDFSMSRAQNEALRAMTEKFSQGLLKAFNK